MALLKTLRWGIVPLLGILSACGGGGENPTSTNNVGLNSVVGPFPDLTPNVLSLCDNPVILEEGYVINGQPVFEVINRAVNFINDPVLESNCYLTQSQLIVPFGVNLTIKPNTIIMFGNRSAGLTILGGSIIASGTANGPIHFTGAGEASIKNYWAGIRVYRRDPLLESIFNYTVIEFGGSGNFSNSKAGFGVIHHRDDAGKVKGRLTFTNNIIRQTAQNQGGYAFLAQRDSYFTTISNNIFYQNAVNPISITVNEMHFLDNNNKFEYAGLKNLRNNIVIANSVSSTDEILNTSNSAAAFSTKKITWLAHDIPYLFEDKIRVLGSDLTIEAGAELQFKDEAGITIEGANASLTAIGTASNRILLTKSDEESSIDSGNFWQGIQFTNTKAIENKLDYVDIRFGGQSELNANLMLNNFAQVSVSNSTMQLSQSGYGFYLGKSSKFIRFTDNLISLNNLGAGKVAIQAISSLDHSSDYRNNTNGYIEVVTSNSRINNASTIHGINIPYVFFNNLFVNGSLTIQPGATLLFARNIRIAVSEQAQLTAIGTPSQPIYFSSIDRLNPDADVNTYWAGITFKNSSGSIIDNAVIEYAGYTNFGTNPTINQAGISLISNPGFYTELKIENSIIQKLDINTYGIYISDQANLSGNSQSNVIENGCNISC